MAESGETKYAGTDGAVRRALLIIDPQNDFLDAQGAFSKRHRDPRELAATIGLAARAARQGGALVVWVTSIYGEGAAVGGEGAAAARAGETHTGAPCCVAGSWGAALYAPLATAVADEDLRITKGWYSAFRETALHEALQARGITEVALAGVSTNVCVAATARAAHALGYGVSVLADATTAGTLAKHERTLHELAALGVQRRAWADAFLQPAPGAMIELTGLGAGQTRLLCGALADVVDGATFEALRDEVAWSAMRHRGGEVPRLVALQGDCADGVEPLYRHPADEQPGMCAWTPLVDRLRRAVEREVGHALNHALIQLYRHGKDWISEHSDKTLDLVRPSFIVNVSLGARRTMVLRPKRTEGLDNTARPLDAAAIQRVPLPHASLLLMDLETNQRWFHAIKQEADADGPRISLTFRAIGTRWDPAIDAVWGSGAPTSDRTEAIARARQRAARSSREREVADRAEAERMIQLFRDENVNPAFDPAAYRPGFELRDLGILNAVAAEARATAGAESEDAGRATDGAVTDGAATDGAATDGAATDGAATAGAGDAPATRAP